MFCATGVPGGGIGEGSHVWICTATHSVTRVSIIDANRPADILHHFDVSTSQLLCIAYVPGIPLFVNLINVQIKAMKIIMAYFDTHSNLFYLLKLTIEN